MKTFAPDNQVPEGGYPGPLFLRPFRIEEDEVNYTLDPSEPIPQATDSVDMLLGVVEKWLDNEHLDKVDVKQLVRALRTSRQPKGK